MSGQLEALTIFTGPMNSGKTRHLLDHFSVARDALEYSILVFRAGTDDRNNDLNQITCRNGGSWCAIPTPRTENGNSSSLFILDFIYRNKQLPKPDLVGIDEVQFFDKDIKEVVKYLNRDGIEVAVSGLNRDFRGEPFPAMELLMPLATRIESLTAVCTYKNGDKQSCGNTATMTQRLIDGLPASYNCPTIVIEGKDKNIKYEARCLKHWFCPDLPQPRLVSYLKR